ncbi:hypothetical protein [Acidithiobacillus sp. AMEEHan]|uniref:hypothetical protein n=1 Tax=Acidithiobacillus sp. AMEEHan TaxID=2994951 RepID=UPI0027E55575|nr:hypothetical protein [Acidithiobacillus sp. AMEEHan]
MATSVTKSKTLAKEVRFINFLWEAKGLDAKARQKGEMTASSANVVKANLLRVKLTPTVIKKARSRFLTVSAPVMMRQLSTMIIAGCPWCSDLTC